MNREQRRRAAATAARRSGGINWAVEQPHLCSTATTVIQLVQLGSDGWVVEHEPCDRCGLHATVAHPGEQVFACLVCGTHGKIDADGRSTHGRSTHTADGMRLQ